MAGQRGLPRDLQGHDLSRLTVDDDGTARWECACGASGDDEPTEESAEYEHRAHAEAAIATRTRPRIRIRT